MRTLMAVAMMALAMEAAQAAQAESYCGRRCKENLIKIDESIAPLWRDALDLNDVGHCGIGRPQPWGGDVPVWLWLQEMRLCKEYLTKVNKIVKRYPPPDPRKRE
jgi:hypothetical protein